MEFSKKVLGNIGRCIYCGTSELPLSEEHIVPYALNGRWTLQSASCSKCSGITSQFERDVTQNLLASTRAFHQFKTRHPSLRPVSFPVEVIHKNGVEEKIEIPIEEYGAVTTFPIFEAPGYITKNHIKGILFKGHALNRNGGMDLIKLSKKYDAKAINFSSTFSPVNFARLIAKIAYGFAVSQFGLDEMKDSYVLPAILKQKDEIGEWVGIDPWSRKMLNEDLGMEIFYKDGKMFATVRIFGKLEGAQTYIVVLGPEVKPL